MICGRKIVPVSGLNFKQILSIKKSGGLHLPPLDLVSWLGRTTFKILNRLILQGTVVGLLCGCNPGIFYVVISLITLLNVPFLRIILKDIIWLLLKQK